MNSFEKFCELPVSLLEKRILKEDFGQYIIRVQLIDEETGEIVDGSEINQSVSGDEFAWGKLEEIRELLDEGSLDDIEMDDEEDTSDLQDLLGVSISPVN